MKPILKIVTDPLVKVVVDPLKAATAAGKANSLEPGQRLPLVLRIKAWWEGYDADEMQRRLDGNVTKTPAKPAAAKAPKKAKLPDSGALWEKAWTEQRVKAAELIWGEGFCGPGGPEYIINLSKRLSLTPEMSMLSFGAGMGGPVRALAKSFGVWVEGLEGSAPLAAVGQEMSVMAGLGKKAPIIHYDMEKLIPFERSYDRVLAKESMFTIGDKGQALSNVEQCLKNGGLFLSTDYLLKDPSALDDDDVQDWIAGEPVRPFPATVDEMEEMMQDAKFSVRVSEDITEMHQSMITEAWSKTESVMPKLAEECQDEEGQMFMEALLTEAEIWSRRVRLMSEGKLVAWRFLAGKKKIVLMSGW